MKLNKIFKLFSAVSISLILLLSMTFLIFAGGDASYKNPETGYVVAVSDNADLLTDSEEAELVENMQQITEYCNAFFVTSDKYYSSSTSSYAKKLNTQMAQTYGVSESNSTTFLIDMHERELYIYSGEIAYKAITTANANTITDNTYTYASKGDYYTCAEKTFEQIYSVLAGQKIARPMKYITAALLAILIGLFVGYIILKVKTKNTNRRDTEDKKSLMTSKCDVYVKNAVLTKTDKKRHYESSGGSGGGGGGFSGGGGGGGGGGGHGF